MRQPRAQVDRVAHERGETLYGADSKIPLHPTSISEGAASLLPEAVLVSMLGEVLAVLAGAVVVGVSVLGVSVLVGGAVWVTVCVGGAPGE